MSRYVVPDKSGLTLFNYFPHIKSDHNELPFRLVYLRYTIEVAEHLFFSRDIARIEYFDIFGRAVNGIVRQAVSLNPVLKQKNLIVYWWFAEI